MVPFFFEEVLLGQGCWLFGLFPFFAHSKSGQSLMVHMAVPLGFRLVLEGGVRSSRAVRILITTRKRSLSLRATVIVCSASKGLRAVRIVSTTRKRNWCLNVLSGLLSLASGLPVL